MGLLRTAAHMAVASSVHGKVQRRQQSRFAAQDAAAAASAAPVAPPPAPAAPPPPPAPVAAPPPAAPDLLGQLAKLGELRAAGILTEAEFETQKARILAQ